MALSPRATQDAVDHAVSAWSQAAALIDARPSARAGDARACRPWSHADYAARLATYTSEAWFARPVPATRERCAALGWRCVAKDTVRCASCERESVFPAFADEDAEARNAVAFAGALQHEERCPWRDNPYSASDAPGAGMATATATARDPDAGAALRHVREALDRATGR